MFPSWQNYNLHRLYIQSIFCWICTCHGIDLMCFHKLKWCLISTMWHKPSSMLLLAVSRCISFIDITIRVKHKNKNKNSYKRGNEKASVFMQMWKVTKANMEITTIFKSPLITFSHWVLMVISWEAVPLLVTLKPDYLTLPSTLSCFCQ